MGAPRNTSITAMQEDDHLQGYFSVLSVEQAVFILNHLYEKKILLPN